MCLVYDEDLACVHARANEEPDKNFEDAARLGGVDEGIGEVHNGQLTRSEAQWTF